jgi:PucR C-terminal helix-turn-helix domain
MRPATGKAGNGPGSWPAVPREVAEALWPELDRATEEVIGAIQREVPEYARPADGSYTATVRRAVHQAVHQFARQIADPSAPLDEVTALFAGIGRLEAAEGRSLEPLQAALRLGARVTWRTLCEQATAGNLSIGVIGPVGEALFLYLDELAAACADGFTRASAEVAGELERRRRRLLDLIVTEPPVSREAVADQARLAGWALPRRVAVVALEDRREDDFGPPPALPPDVLVDTARQDPCLLVPDPDGPGRARVVERGLRGWAGALGPAVPLGRASHSLRWARQVLALARRGSVPARPGLIRCDEHLTELVLAADGELARVLAASRLAPLAGLRPVQQDLLADTLLAWLRHAGNARLAAADLHVHPQTVRYRLRQIHDLFGAALAGPGARFDLELALRARRLTAEAARPAGPATGQRATPAGP